TFHQVGGVGLTGDGVHVIAVSIVAAEVAVAIVTRIIEAVVPIGARRNIYGDSIIWSQLAGRSDHRHDLVHKLRMRRCAKIRRRSWIDPGLGRISARQSEWP